MKPKIFALYLPQFYAFKENNEWWGEGYTDWVAVQNSQSLYREHYQPHVPINNDYYNLTNVPTLMKQADTATKYGVNGFCIYHYWSKGKKLMEKPLELLRDHSEINIEYFISWANHDFKKTWFNGDGQLMWPQEYGDDKDIVEHYSYLSDFFKDTRYFKIDNRPVLKIYNIYHISNFNYMMEKWNKLAVEDGFSGIYLIANKSFTGVSSQKLQESKYVNASFIFEPLNVRANGANERKTYILKRRLKTVLLRYFNKFSKSTKPELFDYKRANETMLKRKKCGKQFYCIFPNWDNTPRYGGKGIVFSGATPELFGYYAKKNYQRSIAENNEILLVNAWNEWGESAHLEPDEKYGYQYLEELKKAIE